MLAVIDADVKLRYKIELYANNMINGPPSTISSGTRLELLLEHQKRWNRLSWASVRHMPFPMLPQTGQPESNENAILTRGTVLAVFTPLDCYFRFIHLPSKYRGLQYVERNVELPQVKLADLDIDATQDLMLTLEFVGNKMQLALRRLADGLPHPLASETPLASYWPDSSLTTVRIFGRYVALLLRPEWNLACELSVWDWQTARLVTFIRKHSIASFTFISEQYVLLAEVPKTSSKIRLQIADLQNPRDPIVCSLHIPEMPRKGADVFSSSVSPCNIQAGPFSSSSSMLSDDPVPFMTSEENGLIAVTLTVYRGEAFALFTLPNKLLNIARARRDGVLPVEIPWEEWGPDNTRVVEINDKMGQDLFVFGTRAAVMAGNKLTLYDFNQRSIKRDLLRGAEALADTIHSEPSEIVGALSFNVDLTTRLPCRITEVQLNEPVGNREKTLHLGEDSIVLIPNEFEKDIEIFTF
ncbi:hypothetical protein AX17_003882 [Amanita inopinata Kibby_2008]|nr:hypothetical protein AX17_003882 [Amanita inopinata Kibby_2008]